MTIVEIVAKLEAACEAYYNSDTDLMSDVEFDALRADLKKADPNHPFLKKVGARPSVHLAKVKHKIPMNSLSKADDPAELNSWFSKHGEEVVGMFKVDGSSIEIIYKNGVLVQASTRGDGLIGEDVTKNVLRFKNVPRKLKVPFTGSVRGEAILLTKDFREKCGGVGAARNIANGAVRRETDDGTEDVSADDLSFIGYDLANGKKFVSHSAKLLELATTMGFEVVEYQVLKDVTEALPWHKLIGERRAGLPYEVDGIVIRVNEETTFESLGENSEARPKGAVAYKWEALGATTTLEGYELTIGTQGQIVPNARMKPVQIGGVTISNALLNNFEEIERLGIQIGDEVKVIRAKDVIPKIIGVAKKGAARKPIPIPTECPFCGGKLVKDGANIFCRAEDCDGKLKKRVKSWVTKRNILYYGDFLLDYLYNKGVVTEPSHLYSLTEKQLAAIPQGGGVVGDRAKSVIAEIEKSKDCPLNELMGSVAIRMLGRREAQHLIDKGVDTLNKFFALTEQQAAGMMGPNKGPDIVKGIQKAKPIIAALLAVGVRVKVPDLKEALQAQFKKDTAMLFTGKSFCFTGAIQRVEDGKRLTRDQMWELVRANGGSVDEEMRTTTTFLVQADPSSVSSKTKKAEKYGTKILAEADFFKMLGK